jgi:hypothetical protein
MEHMIRACLIALRLGERLGIDAEQRAVVYYSGLLAWVGCHTDAYEQAKWLAVKGEAHYGYDLGKPGPTAAFLQLLKVFSPTVAPPRRRTPMRTCPSMAHGRPHQPIFGAARAGSPPLAHRYIKYV